MYICKYLIHVHTIIYTQLNRDVPGIDAAFLAMDTDDGVEVVWNEVRYSDRKVAKGSKVSSWHVTTSNTVRNHVCIPECRIAQQIWLVKTINLVGQS